MEKKLYGMPLWELTAYTTALLFFLADVSRIMANPPQFEDVQRRLNDIFILGGAISVESIRLLILTIKEYDRRNQ